MNPKEDRTDDELLRTLGAHVREEQRGDDDRALPPGTPPFDEALVERITARLLSGEPAASSATASDTSRTSLAPTDPSSGAPPEMVV
ncbi:MAG TPA: hypothetical protein VM580_32445, partial [Labilithrix sp.]|nr:hypothetical protein [Labilithrix sp.]